MHTIDDFAGSIEIGDHFVRLAEHLKGFSGHQAAHSGGETGLLLNDAVGARADLGGHVICGAAKVFIDAILDKGVVAFHRCLKGCAVCAGKGCGGFNGIAPDQNRSDLAFVGDPAVEVGLGDAVFIEVSVWPGSFCVFL